MTSKLTALWLSGYLILNGGAPILAAPPVGVPPPADPDPGISTADAARFLEQATFGPTFATRGDPNYPVSVARVQELGYEGWLNEQFNMEVRYPDNPNAPNFGTNYASPQGNLNTADPYNCLDAGGAGGLCWSPLNRPNTCTNTSPSNCQRDNYTAYLLQNQFFANALTRPDQLRQRVAWALTQIDVVSETDGGIVPASWMTPYLQLFDRDAFGNYRDLLGHLTLNPAMGEYLNMRGNKASNVNENYAREILQLFSIGLNELNDVGSVQIDENGDPIPTYGQDIITAFARVFTAWDLNAQLQPGNIVNYRDPMVIVNEGQNHDHSEKTLLGGQTINDTADAELAEALDNIFNHRGPNGEGGIGPFLAKQLIQKMVTSNPSGGYVRNVTNAFNNGSYTGLGGTTFSGFTGPGDMQATIAAVLLDPEARTAPTDGNYGHLREPVLFLTNTLRAVGNFNTDFVLGDQFLPPEGAAVTTNVRMDQDVFRPATVFSYYPPDNTLTLPDGTTLLAPELAIQSTFTALAHVNIIYDIAYHKMPTSRNRPTGTWIDTTAYEPLAAGDATALIDDAPDGSTIGLNTILMHGNMSSELRNIVLTEVLALPETDLTARVEEAIYLIASSPEYQVER